MNTPRVTFDAKLQRKHPKLAVYVVVPAPSARALELGATAVVEGAVNGHLFGRRTIERWDASEHSPWFVELESAPDQSRALRAAWNRLSDCARRTNAEQVHAGKSPAARSRRTAAIIAALRQGGQPRPA